MAKIVGKAGSFQLDKRFYIPGICVEDTCPVCGGTIQADLSSEYLSYPNANEEHDMGFYCYHDGTDKAEEEEAEWIVKVKVIVGLELTA